MSEYYLFKLKRAVNYFHLIKYVKIKAICYQLCFDFDIKTHFFKGILSLLAVEKCCSEYSDCLFYKFNYHINQNLENSINLFDAEINCCSFLINLIIFKYYNNYTYI